MAIMYRTGLVLCLIILFACNNNKTSGSSEDGDFDYENFSERFKAPAFPYQLTDAQLLNNKDTTAIRGAGFLAFMPDSIMNRFFGKGAKVRYIPLAKALTKDAESYFVMKAVSGAKKLAVLLVFNKEKTNTALFPFLVPDTDPATTQTSTIDKSFSITRALSRKMKNDVTADGKEVYIYNEALNTFTLIMTDVLDNSNLAVINPIDTFPRKTKFAGDYLNGNRNIVSIRDSKNPSEINFFIHFEKSDCKGELKGTALFTSGTTAVYRQGGDPCVLELNFSGRTVSLREAEGCGLHREVKCVFDGKFTKKPEPKPKAPAKKPKKKIAG
jgi:hypothetical protein